MRDKAEPYVQACMIERAYTGETAPSRKKTCKQDSKLELIQQAP